MTILSHLKTYEEGGITSYTFNYDITKKELLFEIEDYHFKITLEENGFKILITGNKFNLTISASTNVENNIISYNFDSSGSYSENNNSYTGSIKMTLDGRKIDKIENFNIANAKSYKEITEEEITSIQNKLENAIKETYIESLIQMLQNTINNILENVKNNNEIIS